MLPVVICSYDDVHSWPSCLAFIILKMTVEYNETMGTSVFALSFRLDSFAQLHTGAAAVVTQRTRVSYVCLAHSCLIAAYQHLYCEILLMFIIK